MQLDKKDHQSILSDKLLLITLIEKLINAILSETKNLPYPPTKFNCKVIPKISVGEYLKRIAKFAHCSNSVYVVALIYIDRLQERVENFVINNWCIHRLLICCMMVAIKWMQDFYYKNEYYAKIGGITKAEIDQLELQLLGRFNFSVHISEEEFKTYLQKLQTYLQVNE